MEYKIISQQEADWQKFKELRLEALKTDQAAFGASYEAEAEKPDTRWIDGLNRIEKPLFFIESEGKYVAMAGARPVDDANAYLLIAMYVSKDYRGKGFAQMLVQKLEEELQRRGIDDFDLIVNKDQEPAVNLYKKLGFTIINETEESMGDGKTYPCFFMSKRISRN